MWDLYTIGGIEVLPDIFNGIAAMVGGGTVSSAVKISVLVGLVWGVFRVAFGEGWDSSLKWFAMMNVIFQGLLLPTVTVRVVDRLVPSNPGVAIAGVPFGLGVFASASSQLGDLFTKDFETVFSLPDDLKYQKTGMMFGNGLIAAMRQVEIPDSEFAGNIREFMNQCVFYDIMLGHIPLDEMKKADNLWQFVTSTYPPSPARSFKLTTGGTEQIVSCQDGATALANQWNGEIDQVETLFGRQMYPGKSDIEAKSLLLSQLPIAHEYLIGASRSAADALQQSMMLNATNAALQDFVSQSNNSAALTAYAEARADSQTETTYRAIARQAEQWVPLLRVVLEALFYAIFPLVIVVSVLPVAGPKVIYNYWLAFMWLQSWPPLYAILNRVMMGHAQSKMIPLGQVADGTPSMTMVSHAGIGAVTDDVAVLAGYLTMSVPFIAMAVVRGATAVMGLATSVLSVGQRAASQAAGEAATGNLSLGNTSFDTHSFNSLQGNRISNAPSFNQHGLTQTRADGATETWADSGRYILNAQQSSFGTDVGLSHEIAGSLRRSAGESMRVAEQQSVAATQAHAAAVESATGFGLNLAQRVGSSHGFDKEISSGEGQSLAKAAGFSSDLASRYGLSREEANQVIQRAGLEVSGGFGTPGGFPISFGAKASTGQENQEQRRSSVSHAVDDARKWMQSEDGKAFLDTSTRLAERNNLSFGDDNAKSLQESFRAHSSESHQLSESASASREQARSLEVQASEAENASAYTRSNYNDAFLEHLRGKYGAAAGESIATDMSAAGLARKEQEARSFADQYVRGRMGMDFNPSNANISSDGRLRSARGRLDADFDGSAGGIRSGADIGGFATSGAGSARSMYGEHHLATPGGGLAGEVGEHRAEAESRIRAQQEAIDRQHDDLKRAQSEAEAKPQTVAFSNRGASSNHGHVAAIAQQAVEDAQRENQKPNLGIAGHRK